MVKIFNQRIVNDNKIKLAAEFQVSTAKNNLDNRLRYIMTGIKKFVQQSNTKKSSYKRLKVVFEVSPP